MAQPPSRTLEIARDGTLDQLRRALLTAPFAIGHRDAQLHTPMHLVCRRADEVDFAKPALLLLLSTNADPDTVVCTLDVWLVWLMGLLLSLMLLLLLLLLNGNQCRSLIP
jgi:hypothetical protein